MKNYHLETLLQNDAILNAIAGGDLKTSFDLRKTLLNLVKWQRLDPRVANKISSLPDGELQPALDSIRSKHLQRIPRNIPKILTEGAYYVLLQLREVYWICPRSNHNRHIAEFYSLKEAEDYFNGMESQAISDEYSIE